MADIRPVTDQADVDFSRQLVEEYGVATVPGSSFYRDAESGRNLIRFAFCKTLDLLEEAGVDTVKELRNRNAANLHAALIDTNAQKGLVRRLPSQNQVKDWISQAKGLPVKVTY